MWVTVLFAVAAAVYECPLFTCANLDAGICANITSIQDKTVELNSQGCRTTYGCDLDQINADLSAGRLNSFLCTEIHPVEYNFPLYKCPTRVSQRALVEGEHPKTCGRDDDCQLQDGTLAECICGLSRTKMCQPDINDELYLPFWTYCAEHENNLTETMRYVWLYYYFNFVVMASAPPCADDILIQLWLPKVETRATALLCSFFLLLTSS